MRAFMCSSCDHLVCDGECTWCLMNIEYRPKYREENSKEQCLYNFKQIDEDEKWHKPASWEK